MGVSRRIFKASSGVDRSHVVIVKASSIVSLSFARIFVTLDRSGVVCRFIKSSPTVSYGTPYYFFILSLGLIIRVPVCWYIISQGHSYLFLGVLSKFVCSLVHPGSHYNQPTVFIAVMTWCSCITTKQATMIAYVRINIVIQVKNDCHYLKSLYEKNLLFVLKCVMIPLNHTYPHILRCWWMDDKIHICHTLSLWESINKFFITFINRA